MLGALRDHVEHLSRNLPGAVLVTGGERIFAAGAEIREFGGPPEAASYGALFREAFSSLAALPRATVAAINGYALGGGLELALACDFRIAAENAKLGQPEVLLGIIPGGGGSQRLARLVGPSRAKEIIFTGRQVGADEAEAIGLVDQVLPPDEVQSAALAFATQLASGAVAAQALAKRAIDEGLDGQIEEGLQLEQDLFVESFRTDDSRIGIQSFLEHGPGKAQFTGR
jgi:enoyl-CoA hydratase